MAYTKEELKAEALRLAHNTFEPANTVVERAKEYVRFLTGDKQGSEAKVD